MNSLKKFLLPVLFMFFLLVVPSGNINAQLSRQQEDEYAVEWLKIDALIEKGLPQLALEELDQLQALTFKRNHSPQYVKCILYRIKLQADFEESSLENNIYLVEQEINNNKTPVKQILHSVLARLYWNYYVNNRFQLLDRLPGVEYDPNDLLTWDINRLVSATLYNYEESLKDPRSLKSTDLKMFDALLEKADKSKHFRPTLFDFLAHEAVDFFMSEETYLTRPAESFVLNNPDYFSDAVTFTKIEISSPDTLSLKFYAVKLFQEILKTHINDSDPIALIDADLKRLSFVNRHMVLNCNDSLYRKALRILITRYSGAPSVTDIYYQLANSLYKQGDNWVDKLNLKKNVDSRVADSLCTVAINKYPETTGAKNCKVLQQNIRSRSILLRTEYGNLPLKPVLASLNYRNIKEIYGRIVRIDPEQHRLNLMKMDTKALLDFFLAEPVINTFNYSLPHDNDFQSHTAEIAIPALDPGFYVIITSSSSQFHVVNDVFSWTPLWISRISYINKTCADGSLEFFILDRESGRPLKNVNVNSYVYEYEYASRSRVNKLWKTFTTDKNGYFIIPGPIDKKDSRSLMFTFEAKNDRFSSENPVYLSYQGKINRKVSPRTQIFTDRAIYRPGQTVWFKAIVYEGLDNKYSLVKNALTSVSLYDVNGQVVTSKDFKTNEFGSFSGSFVLPVGKLNGNMRIACNYGSANIRVEEYKRPRFEVVFEPVKETFKLGEVVNVTIKALSFAGAPLDQANVSYRVTRKPSYPFWYDFRCLPPRAPQTEITNGVGKTNVKGEFVITFNALPDPEIPSGFDPVYTYVVHSEVVDINGETHAKNQNIIAGYKALMLSVDLKKMIQRNELKSFSIISTNISGLPATSNGQFRFSKLKSPEILFKNKLWERPDRFVLSETEYRKQFPDQIYNNEDDTASWAVEKVVLSQEYNNAKDSIITIKGAEDWEPGIYCLEIESTDIYGSKVKYPYFFTLFDQSSGKPACKTMIFNAIKEKLVEPGQNAVMLIGSSAKKINMLVEISKENKVISRQWLDISNKIEEISIPVLEEYRGNIDYCVTFIKDNRNYLQTGVFQVPFSNKKLNVDFTHFRDKLNPGENDKIELTVKGPKGEIVQTEALFAMYDASLESFLAHKWDFNLYKPSRPYVSWQQPYIFQLSNSYSYQGQAEHPGQLHVQEYDRLNWFGYNIYDNIGNTYKYGMVRGVEEMDGGRENLKFTPSRVNGPKSGVTDTEALQNEVNEAKEPGSSNAFKVRANFNETAFFYPDLKTNEKGEIVFSYDIPDALTRWNMLGYLHGPGLEYISLRKEIQTLKDLMVFPNLPRFLREGDTVNISIKINNQSNEQISGEARLEVFNSFNMAGMSESVARSPLSQAFSCPAKQSTYIEWALVVPGNIPAFTVRTSAKSGNYTDMEENIIPILSGRALITETMPVAINKPGSKSFKFNKLIQNKSKSLKNHRLSFEFTSNPSWFALQALPSLMEYNHECSEQVFNCLYANGIAEKVLNSNPKVRQVFSAWKQLTPSALLSNLEKNPELKELSLLETPWVMDAANESESKNRVGGLFDGNQVVSAQNQAMQTLLQLQTVNGGWPWYSGLPDNRYITQYILCGIGKMNKMGALRFIKDQNVRNSLAKAFSFLDDRMQEEFNNLQKQPGSLPAGKTITSSQILYIFTHSYFIDDYEVELTSKEAFDYYVKQEILYWNTFNPYMQAMIALSMYRYGNEDVAKDIIRSLRQKALHSPEMGMYWRDIARSTHWSTAPIQQQALMIEAFREIAQDEIAINEMKTWLLKNKQTKNWESSIATADACYALLMRGSDWLIEHEMASFIINDKPLNPYLVKETKVEAGSGYFKTSWTGTEIQPGMGNVIVKKPTEGPAWGAMYWQYFEDISKVGQQLGGPLTIKKKLYVQRNTVTGPVLDPVTYEKPVMLGDKVVVHLEIRCDRELDFVHLKDPRAAGLEPEESLSGYRSQKGLAYYQSVRDASIDFFFPSLNKGTYMFDYTLIANMKGDFSCGPAGIQCYYAPEFKANSNGSRVKIQ